MLKHSSHIATISLTLVLALALGACSDSNSSSGNQTTPPPVYVPSIPELELDNVQVYFPPPVSTTGDDTVLVRGKVENTTDVARLQINGIDVDSDDGLATWTVAVPLVSGTNTLQLTAEDNEGNQESLTELTVTRNIALMAPKKSVLDYDNNRLLVLDYAQNNLVAVDLDSGDRSALSPVSISAANLIEQPRDLILDAPGQRAIVYQFGDKPFIAVDLTSGAQTEIEPHGLDDIILTENPQFMAYLTQTRAPSLIQLGRSAESRAMTNAVDGAYVADAEIVYLDQDLERVEPEEAVSLAVSGIVYHMDLSTGERTVVSNYGTPNTEFPIRPEVLSMDTSPDSDQIYLLERSSNIYQISGIDKNTGARTLVFPATSDAEDEDIESADINEGNGGDSESVPEEEEAVVNDEDEDTDDSDDTSELMAPRVIRLDYANNRLWLLNARTTVAQIDLSTKEATIVASSSIPEDADFPLVGLESITLNTQEQEILAVDDAYDQVLRIDTNTGERTRLSGTGVPDPTGSTLFTTPTDVTLDIQNHRAFVLDSLRATIFDVNLNTGSKTVLADNANPDNDKDHIPMAYPIVATLGPDNESLLVLNNLRQRLPSVAAGNPGLLDIALSDGNKSNLFTYGVNAQFRDIAYVASQDAYYVAKSNYIRKLSKAKNDEEELEYSIFSASNRPTGAHPFFNLRALAVDAAHHRLLALDSAKNAVLAVDLETGARTLLSGQDFPESGEALNLVNASDIVVDNQHNRALVLDPVLKAIIAVDLTTGEKSMVVDNETVEGTRNRLSNPRRLDLHPIFNYVVVVDETLDVLMAIDLETNQRVILSR